MNEKYAHWRFANPYEKMTPAIFNKSLAEAFAALVADPTTKAKIQRSFAESNLFPLRDTLAPENLGDTTDKKKTNKVLKNVQTVEAFVTDVRDQETMR